MLVSCIYLFVTPLEGLAQGLAMGIILHASMELNKKKKKRLDVLDFFYFFFHYLRVDLFIYLFLPPTLNP